MLLTRSCSGPRSQCIGLQGRSQPQLRCVVVSSAATELAPTEFEWKGSDEFSALEDRKDLPPLPLPAIKTRRRVVLVRHGQSTWNAEGRIQGSSNFSCLTPKGIAQAETTRDMASAVSCVSTSSIFSNFADHPVIAGCAGCACPHAELYLSLSSSRCAPCQRLHAAGS
jgi:hypothetical protein